MDIKTLIHEYYTSCKIMQLATSSGDQPWICTVHFTSDDDLNLYWASSHASQHSQEIMNNSKTAVTIVIDVQNKQALQIKGNAYLVADDQLEHVHELYTSKFGPNKFDLEEMKKHTPNGRAYWIFKPIKISLFDEFNFPDTPKQHYIVSPTAQSAQ